MLVPECCKKHGRMWECKGTCSKRIPFMSSAWHRTYSTACTHRLGANSTHTTVACACMQRPQVLMQATHGERRPRAWL